MFEHILANLSEIQMFLNIDHKFSRKSFKFRAQFAVLAAVLLAVSCGVDKN